MLASTGTAVSGELRDLRTVLRMFSFRGWFVVGLGVIVALVLIGVPASIIDNPFFVRMTPVRMQDYVIWPATAGLVGLISGTFTLPALRVATEGKVLSGGFLSFLAVGCPICNKVVVLLLGVSGALTYFAPLQMYIGLASLLLLAWTLRLRVRALVGACQLPSVQKSGLSAGSESKFAH